MKSIENTAYALPLYSAILRCITSCFTSKVEFCNDANHISGFFTVSTFRTYDHLLFHRRNAIMKQYNLSKAIDKGRLLSKIYAELLKLREIITKI